MNIFRKYYASQQNKYNCVPCLIKKQKWKKIIKIITEQHKDHRLAVCTCQNTCKDHERYPSLLHFACKFNPPLSAVKTLLSVDENSPLRVDQMNRHPLHIACEYGACPTVIRYLTKQNPLAAATRDVDGNTPLHLTVRYYSSTQDLDLPFDTCEITVTIMENIEILCRAAPISVTIQNNKDMTALDCALMIRLDVSVIVFLRTLTRLEEQGYSNLAWLRELEDSGRMMRISKKAKVMPI